MKSEIGVTFAAQDGLITRRQASGYLSDAELRGLLGRFWRVVLPGVYADSPGEITWRQRVRAALLYAGDGAMLADATGLRAYRAAYLPADHFVRVLVADNVQRPSRDFVVLRRTTRLPVPVMIGGLPVVPMDRALCEFVARHADERESFAVAAAAVQTGRVKLGQIVDEAERGPARGRPRLVRTIASLSRGVRSLPERDFMDLADRSKVLPSLLYNCLIQLPDGQRLRPDALAADAALIHETNGRRFHAPEEEGGDDDLFEQTQWRADVLTAAGFTVLGNAPKRIRSQGPQVIGMFEECYLRDRGRGLPDGVTILRTGPGDTDTDVTSLRRKAS